jgi:hypothetical protein
MKKPSKEWKCMRLAVLERARRTAIEPLEAIFAIHAAVCVYYVVGCLYFQLFDHSPAFSVIEALQLLSVAIAGVLVPILTGAVFTLHFADRKLRRLANE